jgi:hypothetical protein
MSQATTHQADSLDIILAQDGWARDVSHALIQQQGVGAC